MTESTTEHTLVKQQREFNKLRKRLRRNVGQANADHKKNQEGEKDGT